MAAQTIISAAYEPEEAVLVKKAASKLGMTPSAFLRHISVIRAKKELKEAKP